MRFTNAPFLLEEQTARAQWPNATMTWGERRLFSDGWLIQRDAQTSPATMREPPQPYARPSPFRESRSRQDAPAGAGTLLIHSTVALERSRRGFTMPDASETSTAALPLLGGLPPSAAPGTEAALTQRWEPMRARTAGSTPSGGWGAAAQLMPVEQWQSSVRDSFPRCTGHAVRVDKAALAEARAAARWASRLAARGGGPSPWQ